MALTYGFGLAAALLLGPWLPEDPLAAASAVLPIAALAALFSVRPSYALWMAIDNLVDPVEREWADYTDDAWAEMTASEFEKEYREP
jgi:hypothetical protein